MLGPGASLVVFPFCYPLNYTYAHRFGLGAVCIYHRKKIRAAGLARVIPQLSATTA